MSAALKHGRQFQVWGSSIGWLVFYAVLTYGIKAVGMNQLRSFDQPQSLSTVDYNVMLFCASRG